MSLDVRGTRAYRPGMRAAVALVLLGTTLLILGVWVLPTQDIGGIGERPTGYLYVAYLGLVCLASAFVLALRHLWRGNPRGSTLLFLLGVGLAVATFGEGNLRRGASAGPILLGVGLVLVAVAASLAVRGIQRRLRPETQAGAALET